MKRVSLRVKDLNEQIISYNLSYTKKDSVVLLDNKIILVNEKPTFFYFENKLVPTLKLLQENNPLKKIVIDMNAIKFIINGADVMRPGIKEIDLSIKKDEVISIVDFNNKKAIAIGIALFDGNEMQNSSSGKVIKTIHYVGDEIWKMV